MAWDNDHIPEIVYEYDDSEAKRQIAEIAATLDKNGLDAGGDHLRKAMANASVMTGQAVNKTVNATIKEVTDLMKSRQYHSKSGYVGHGNMVSQVKDHLSNDDHKHEIYTDATAKDGYNYSQAFEFGLLTKNYPAHHPYEDAGNHLKGELEKNVDEALRRGFS